ncbi:hypothetical protein [Pseudomonas sp. RIT-PI-AD]|uniref:hypothetical protein n=1 Tax=Pseudomonas sp. RIT-PI-AD TaxID=3035294 RepID=UPI0021D858EC|nr:hypothetical protein [Pseudomonas sp. RIT-PI-AD]
MKDFNLKNNPKTKTMILSNVFKQLFHWAISKGNTTTLIFIGVMGFAGTATPKDDAPNTSLFEGRYHGQGRGCGGVLTIRSKYISWHSEALSCEIRSYTNSEEEHNGYGHRIIYRIKQKNKACRLYAIELGHSDQYPSYLLGWYITGFFTQKEFDDRQEPASARYACALIKDYNPHNNPEPTDLPVAK